jgi:peptidoglycan/LPS O-acetylase OafA/YrhL
MHEMRQDINAAPAWLSRGRIPGLDALRAVSIVLVLAAHVLFAARYGTDMHVRARVLSFGFLGVDFFFVISGFLITLLLLREQDRTGNISLRGFYRRRALRILPAYLVFLGAMYIATRIGWEQIRTGDWIAALTYTMNWRGTTWVSPAWAVGHVWSLSVEEQFYLLWPPLVMFLSPRALKRVLIGCILVAPIFRVAARIFLPNYEAFGRMSFPARVEPIAAGCLLAMLAVDPAGRALLNRWCRGLGSVLLALFLVIAASILASRSKIFALFGRSTVCAILIPIIVWGCANARHSLVRRALAWKPIVGLGILSYSIYLWQQPFLDGEHHESIVCRFPVSIALVFVAAFASYFLIERPFLMIKDRKPAPKAEEAVVPAL